MKVNTHNHNLPNSELQILGKLTCCQYCQCIWYCHQLCKKDVTIHTKCRK